jgi:hypothetical protein
MLEFAKIREKELKGLFWQTAFDPFYKYMDMCAYREDFSLPKDTNGQHYFTSIWQDKIIGFINYQINREANRVDGFFCVHFGKKHSYIFAKDLMTAIRDIFEEYKFNKINFCVIIGNPVEKTYDRLIKKYGGRIVGVFKNDIKLIDGNLYDLKCYELMAADYFKNKGGKLNGAKTAKNN